MFDLCIEVLFKHEMGYTNNPADKGNWTGGKINAGELKGTKYGISAASYPYLNIRELTKDQAKEIYRNDFWQPLRLYLLDNANICLDIFDFGVNAGPSRAVKIAQMLAGTEEDGILGGITAKAINEYEGDFVKDYKHTRIIYYENLASDKPELNIFLKGWTNRVNQNYFINV